MQIRLPRNRLRNGAIAGASVAAVVFAVAGGLRVILPTHAQPGEVEHPSTVNYFYGAVTIVQSAEPISVEKAPRVAQNFQSPTINGNCNAVGVANSVNCGAQSRVPNDIVSTRLVDELRASGSYKIPITSMLGDGESFQLATKLAAILNAAGWTVDGGGVSQAIYSQPIVGLLVSMAPRTGFAPGTQVSLETLPKAAGALLQAFRQNGIDAMANIDNTIHDADEVRIVVGVRP